jgi:D-beta-D-heptose 7-phosphate kinase/D-beta-D-heptose 1-phosphate adenosyltransferase
MAVFPAAGELLELPTMAREVFDVTGAGDTVIALASLASRVAGVSLEEAAAVANLAAGVVVGKVGTARVSAAEIISYYDHWHQ